MAQSPGDVSLGAKTDTFEDTFQLQASESAESWVREKNQQANGPRNSLDVFRVSRNKHFSFGSHRREKAAL